MLCAPVYIYIRQLSSFRAPTLWLIDLTVATCHIQDTFLSLCHSYPRENRQNTRILEVCHFRVIWQWDSFFKTYTEKYLQENDLKILDFPIQIANCNSQALEEHWLIWPAVPQSVCQQYVVRWLLVRPAAHEPKVDMKNSSLIRKKTTYVATWKSWNLR